MTIKTKKRCVKYPMASKARKSNTRLFSLVKIKTCLDSYQSLAKLQFKMVCSYIGSIFLASAYTAVIISCTKGRV